MKYLVTGGAGFVGSHLVDRLIEKGNQVIVLDDFSTGSERNLNHLRDDAQINVVHGSILDLGLVQELTSQSDRVFHLAAAVGVFNIVEQPLKSLQTNITGSENVFAAALKHKKPILITSSSEIYGKNTSDSLDEESDRIIGAPQKIRWSYSDAKAIDEAMAVSLNRLEGLETRIVRLFNTVGPRQVGRYGMVVPRFISAALQNQPLEVYGSGNQTRCFGHVADIVDAMLKVESNSDLVGKPVNIGSSEEISIIELAKKVIDQTGSSSTIRIRNYEEVYEYGFEDMERRVPNTSLLRTHTGWIPLKSLTDIIEDIAEFMQDKSS